MKKILLLISLLLFVSSVSAVEITGKVKKIYVQSGKIYFELDETGSSNTCHNGVPYKYYYFYADLQAESSDTYYYEKKFESRNYFQLLMLSGATKNDSNPVKITIDISDTSNCGVSSIHINGLKGE